jgi:hypothetical protein
VKEARHSKKKNALLFHTSHPSHPVPTIHPHTRSCDSVLSRPVSGALVGRDESLGERDPCGAAADGGAWALCLARASPSRLLFTNAHTTHASPPRRPRRRHGARLQGRGHRQGRGLQGEHNARRGEEKRKKGCRFFSFSFAIVRPPLTPLCPLTHTHVPQAQSTIASVSKVNSEDVQDKIAAFGEDLKVRGREGGRGASRKGLSARLGMRWGPRLASTTPLSLCPLIHTTGRLGEDGGQAGRHHPGHGRLRRPAGRWLHR